MENKDAETRAWDALRGLALGDAFGQQWFRAPAEDFHRRLLQPAPWPWTDDTAMALVVHGELRRRGGRIDRDALAAAFAAAHRADPDRGYGAGAREVLSRIAAGEPWRSVAAGAFGGQGSYGNGAAMRVAPLGAWWADDPDTAAAEARRSAEVTHAHPEAAAGAVAVAVAAALAAGGGAVAGEFLAQVGDRTPDGEVRAGLEIAARFRDGTSPVHAAAVLGSGRRVSAADTVPFALWTAAQHLDDYTEGLWATAAPGGDTDTTCAIAGGVIAARSGLGGVPEEWRRALEPLPPPAD